MIPLLAPGLARCVCGALPTLMTVEPYMRMRDVQVILECPNGCRQTSIVVDQRAAQVAVSDALHCAWRDAVSPHQMD